MPLGPPRVLARTTRAARAGLSGGLPEGGGGAGGARRRRMRQPAADRRARRCGSCPRGGRVCDGRPPGAGGPASPFDRHRPSRSLDRGLDRDRTARHPRRAGAPSGALEPSRAPGSERRAGERRRRPRSPRPCRLHRSTRPGGRRSASHRASHRSAQPRFRSELVARGAVGRPSIAISPSGAIAVIYETGRRSAAAGAAPTLGAVVDHGGPNRGDPAAAGRPAPAGSSRAPSKAAGSTSPKPAPRVRSMRRPR